MDYMLRQMRGKSSGVQQEKKEELGSGKDQYIPTQKSQSFREKKKGQNWLQRQFSRKMSRDYSSDGELELAAAVAASAYVIDKKQRGQEPPGPSLVPVTSKKEDDGSKRFPFYFGQDSKRSSEYQEGKVPIASASDLKVPQKAVTPASSAKRTPSSLLDKAPSTKRTPSFAQERADLPATSSGTKPPSFADAHLDRAGTSRPGGTTPKVDLPTTAKPRTPPPPPPLPPPPRDRQISTSQAEAKAKAWEEKELAKIKERYEKQLKNIESWERNMREKAHRRRERAESDVENKRKRATQKYNNDMKYIDEVAGGARAKAEEGRRNSLLKNKEKANYIRRTGKTPSACPCF